MSTASDPLNFHNPVPPFGRFRRRFLHADLQFDNDVDFADFAILQKAISPP